MPDGNQGDPEAPHSPANGPVEPGGSGTPPVPTPSTTPRGTPPPGTTPRSTPPPGTTPPPPVAAPEQPLVVAPSTVTLTRAQAQVFTVSPVQPVTWSLLPGNDSAFGAIDPQSGAYTAPTKLWRGRMAIVRAENNTTRNFGTATITLNPDPAWRSFVGALMLVFLVVTAIFVRMDWPTPCICDTTPLVTPAAAWLKPGDTLPLTLAHCAPQPASINWKLVSGPGTVSAAGVFVAGTLAPAAPPADAVIQALDGDQKVLGSATIHITNAATLQIWPPIVSLPAGEHQTFTLLSSPALTAVKWSLDPTGSGTLVQDGSLTAWKYTAPRSIDRPATVKVVATVTNGAAPAAALVGQSVVAVVQLIPDRDHGCQSAKDIYGFVFWMGLLGSYIHTTLSFAAYAGNRKFLASWTWWYVLRPPAGGLLAVLVFFLFGGGYFGKSDVTNSYVVATYAGLVGLFSEVALMKLKEIMETILKPKEERSDKITGGDGPLGKPVISSVVVEDQATKKYAVTGSGFVSGARVKVGTQERTSTFVSNSKLTFTLLPADAGTLQVVVSNPKADGTTVDSAPATLTV